MLHAFGVVNLSTFKKKKKKTTQDNAFISTYTEVVSVVVNRINKTHTDK